METQDLLQLADFSPGRILLSAVELGLFPHLSGEMRPHEIADALGTDLRATRRLLNALVAVGVLELRVERYAIAAGLRPALLPGPECVLPALEHRAHLWRSWSDLTGIVRDGVPRVDPYENDERPEEQVRSFIGAMAVGARAQAPLAVASLDLSEAQTVLDIGGGPGVYAEEFCRASPGIRAVILDFPRVCDIARERLAGGDFASRISFVAGEARTVDDDAVLAASGGPGFDLVFMSSLIHSMDEAQIGALFSRAARWTRAGGRVVVKDFFLDETRTSPPRAAIFAVNMLVNTPGGDSYTWTECEQWLKQALRADGGGEPRVERVTLPDGISGMVVALKPHAAGSAPRAS